MPPLPPVNKPLLLVFPLDRTLHYERCIVVAKYLRSLFDIRFFYTDKQAPLVYQHGFETFSNTFFPTHLVRSISHSDALDHTQLEQSFLEQVELLETLQPALVIGDGISTLSMAAEFTGVPLISIFNGYQSPYYANKNDNLNKPSTHKPFQWLRDKYGLQPNKSFLEEFEGDLNWICDLPELFPQKELPFQYSLIGPLLDIGKPPAAPTFNLLNPLKKTILLDINHPEQIDELDLLNGAFYDSYNLVTEGTKTNEALANRIKSVQMINLSQMLPHIDLLLCNSERLLYRALLHKIPVLLICPDSHTAHLSKVLEHWQLGSVWELENSESSHKAFNYWTNFKQIDTHNTFHYKTKEALVTTCHKLLHSISLHFPFVGKKATSLI